VDVVEPIYRPIDAQGHSKDYEFSRTTMRTRRAQGLSDAQATLLTSPWLAPMPPEVGARTFDVLKVFRPTERPAPRTQRNSARARSEGAKLVTADSMRTTTRDAIKLLRATVS